MDKQIKSTVMNIASQVREWVLKEARKVRYNEKDLCGWCAIASAKLHIELKKKNINSKLNIWNGAYSSHVFLTVDDYIVDITATQFLANHPHVLIIHEKEAEQFEYFKSCGEFKDVKHLRKTQIQHKWPSKQVVYSDEELLEDLI